MLQRTDNLRTGPIVVSDLMLLHEMCGQEIAATDAQNLAECDHSSMVWEGVMPIAAGGVHTHWNGNGIAWTILHRRWRRHARFITDMVMDELESLDMPRRVEMYVACDDAGAHRWATRLGFEIEAERLRCWGPDDRDYSLYARVG